MAMGGFGLPRGLGRHRAMREMRYAQGAELERKIRERVARTPRCSATDCASEHNPSEPDLAAYAFCDHNNADTDAAVYFLCGRHAERLALVEDAPVLTTQGAWRELIQIVRDERPAAHRWLRLHARPYREVVDHPPDRSALARLSDICSSDAVWGCNPPPRPPRNTNIPSSGAAG